MAQAELTLTPYTKRKKVHALRELGIYELPDGRQYVVSTLYADAYSLYPLHAWGNYGDAEYWADREGRLLRRGVPTHWSAQDLKDTGRTSTYPKPFIQ